MAVDKLVDSAQLDADLTSVANAIRTKGGTSAQLAFPADFVQAIDAIETGGGGDYVAADWLDMSKPIGEIYSTAATIPSKNVDGACQNRTGITSLNFPNCTNIRKYTFDGCTGITSIYAPRLAGLQVGALNKVGVTYLVLPSCTYMNGGHGTFANLVGVDFGGTAGSGGLPSSGFSGSTRFNILVLRSSSMWPLKNISAFTGTPFASGGSGGALYVPQALVSQYTQATNWSTILGYANNQILPIEGSIYETQYVDGTPIA